jgi:hypothetical protein
VGIGAVGKKILNIRYGFATQKWFEIVVDVFRKYSHVFFSLESAK